MSVPVIVGAGPAGLCLAARLRRRGFEPLLLEAREIGSTWRRSPPTMRVLSPWWTNVLAGRDLTRHRPFAKVTVASYAEYLEDFARREGIRVERGARLERLRREGAEWVLEGADGRAWRSPLVVLATGYFAAPRPPQPPIADDGSLPRIHVAEVGDYDRFAASWAGRRLLLVGKRVSAGQFMVELARRGVGLLLSVHPPLAYRRAGLLGRLRDQIYYFWEPLRLLVQPGLRANSFPVMDGGETERLVRDGVVRVVGPLAAIREGRAITAEGDSLAVDGVLLATGYRPALELLGAHVPLEEPAGLPACDGFEVRGLPGVFLLGFDQLRDFRSRYLRGIRADSRHLARLIAKRLPPRETGA